VPNPGAKEGGGSGLKFSKPGAGLVASSNAGMARDGPSRTKGALGGSGLLRIWLSLSTERLTCSSTVRRAMLARSSEIE